MKNNDPENFRKFEKKKKKNKISESSITGSKPAILFY